MDIRGGLEFSRTFYRAIGPNRAIMRRMRSKMRKMRSKMRKMRRRKSKMRNQCEDARAKCEINAKTHEENVYPKGTLIYAARLAFLGHDSCICYGIFRNCLHRSYIADHTSTSPSPHIDFLETNGCMGR
jgi:hypothetical protein